jgi:hypothetical protein
MERFNSILNIKSSLEISLIKVEDDNHSIKKNLLDLKTAHNKTIDESKSKELEVSHDHNNF